jgi:hypothetical protein
MHKLFSTSEYTKYTVVVVVGVLLAWSLTTKSALFQDKACRKLSCTDSAVMWPRI